MNGERFLLDTHALIWWLTGDPRLPPGATEQIADAESDVLVSAASVWEIAIKHRSGKLKEADRFMHDAIAFLGREGFQALPILHLHALLAGRLDTPHRDPFDRMLIAQAMAEGLTLISNETLFDTVRHEGRSVPRLWA